MSKRGEREQSERKRDKRECQREKLQIKNYCFYNFIATVNCSLNAKNSDR